MADDIDSILGTSKPTMDAPEGDDIDAILGTAPTPKKDRRGHAYDPRFAPEEETGGRPLKNTGSYDEVMANFRGDKAALASGTPKVYYSPEGVTKKESAARGALQGASLGFGDEAAAAIDTGVSKIPGVRSFAQMFQDASLPPITDPNLTYEQRREAYRGKNRAAQEANPKTYLAGEIAGSVAVPVPGSSLIKGTGIAAKGLNAALTGAKLGAIGGIGSSEADLTTGNPTDFQRVFKDAATGGTVGGVLGGTLGTVGAALVKRAPQAEAQALMRGIAEGEGKAGRATVKATKMLDRAEDNAVSVLRENKDLAKVAAKPAKEALPVFEKHLDEVGSKLDPHYDVVDKATGGVSMTNFANVMNDEIAKLAQKPLNEQYINAVKSIRDSALKAWAPELAAKLAANARAEEAGLAGGVFKNLPDKMVPTREVRAMVTRLQKRGTEVINALNPGESSQMKADMAKMMKGFIDAHLDIAAEQSPEVAKAVDAIRSLNKQYSALSTMTNAIEQRGWKEATGATSGAETLKKTLKHAGLVAAVPMLMHGNIPGAIGTVVAPHLLPLAAKAARGANAGLAQASRSDTTLARMIISLIEAGVPRATAINMARAASGIGGGEPAPAAP